MDFKLSEQQKELQSTARNFAQKRVFPHPMVKVLFFSLAHSFSSSKLPFGPQTPSPASCPLDLQPPPPASCHLVSSLQQAVLSTSRLDGLWTPSLRLQQAVL